MGLYDGYHFVGIHFAWWLIWVVIIFWIFATPYNIPGQRAKNRSALHLLKKRLTSGQINKEEFLEKRKLLQ